MLRKALADVATTFGWHFDADARVFYVPTWWKWNPPENANVMRGALKDLAEIPPCSLVDAFAANVTDIPDEPVKGGANILQTFVEGLRQRLPERSGNQKQYPGTNLASNPRTARIETLARKTLTFTDNGDMATVIDTMFTIARSEGLDDLSKTEAHGVSPWLKCGPIEVQRDAGPRRWQQLRAERDDLQLFDGKEPGVNQLTPGRAAECRAAVGVGGCMTRSASRNAVVNASRSGHSG